MDSRFKQILANTSKYYENRTLEMKIDNFAKEEEYSKHLNNIYQQMQTELDTKLASVYTKYGKDNGITPTQAQQLLSNSALQERQNNLVTYQQMAQAEGNSTWSQQLTNQQMRGKVSVLQDTRDSWNNTIEKLDPKEQTGKFLNKIYQNTKYKTDYMLKDVAVTGSHTATSDRVDRLLKQDWGGANNFSNSVWKNKEQLKTTLDRVLTNGLAKGTNYQKISKEIADTMQVERHKATRLVRTESARIQSQSQVDSFETAGVTHFQFLATLDMKTSDLCRGMDTLVFNMKDKELGVNMPPLHPYCRSAIAPYFDDLKERERAYRDPVGDGKTEKGAFKDYATWMDEVVGDSITGAAIRSNSATLTTLTRALVNPPSPIIQTREKQLIAKQNIEPLTFEEEGAIKSYKSTEGFIIDDILRNDYELPPQYKTLMGNLDKAIDKLPVYQKDTTRSLDIMPTDIEAFLKVHKTGNIVKYKQYLSTTKQGTYNKDANVQILVSGKTGRDLTSISKIEDEVLFGRDTKFHIKYVTTVDEVIYIHMKEVV